jgi:universal stress protein A
MNRITRILVPTDFSDTADAALAYAKELAGRVGASLHLLHVFDDFYTAATFAPEVYGAVPASVRETSLRAAEDHLNERLPEDERAYFNGTTAIATGLTANAIVDYARTHGIDLIVIGTHGRGGIAHLLLGSVAERVLRVAPCPVLTVRATRLEGAGTMEPAAVAAA